MNFYNKYLNMAGFKIRGYTKYPIQTFRKARLTRAITEMHACRIILNL